MSWRYLTFQNYSFHGRCYTNYAEFTKQLQKANLILPDVLTARDSAIRKLELLNDGLIPGGAKEKHLGSFNTEESDDNKEPLVNEIPLQRKLIINFL